MRHLVIDAEINGTGIKDKFNAGFVAPALERLVNQSQYSKIVPYLRVSSPRF